MFRSLRAGNGAARQAVLVVLPVLIGAVLLLASGDDPQAGTTRVAATQGVGAARVIEGAGDPGAAPGPTGTASDSPPAPAPGVGPAGAPSPTDPSTAGATTTGATPTTTAAPAATARVEPAAAPSADPAVTTTAAPTAPTAGPITTAGLTTTTAPATTTTAARPRGPVRAAGVEAEVVPLTNRDRNAAGLGSLARNSCLDAVASGYAETMARGGVLAHNPGAGAAVTGCRANATWGDNVGTAAPCDTALLEDRWMASPSHRRNILTGAFQLIGVGAWHDEQGGCWIQVLFST